MKAFILLTLLLTGCANFNCGIGYQKVPNHYEEQIFRREALLGSMNQLGFSPQQIEFFLSLLGTEAFEQTIQALFPVDNKVNIGIWIQSKE